MHFSDPTDIQIERCDPATDKATLALAAQAWPEAERAAYWQAIAALVRAGRAERVVLLAARCEQQLLGVQLAQVLPGRVAVAWPPQFTSAGPWRREPVVRRLVERLTADLAASGADLVQALLAQNDPAGAGQFALGGFTHAADLLYLSADLTAPADALPMPSADAEKAAPPFQLEPFTLGREQRLIELIERTYVGTLDCPQIDGLRKTADVVAGYKAVGQFQPELWQLVRYKGADVGCLLVNLHRDVQHAEIVYVALVPEVRGRGWGLALTRHAERLARDAHCQRLVLAVDATNAPAIRLYSAVGFTEFDRRAVWIKPLAKNPQSLAVQ